VSGRREWGDAVRTVEQAGFSVLTVMDHFRSGGVWSALVSAYQAAPSLRVGTLVLNNDVAHPLVVAREAITTDVLTDGSMELGIGAGWDTEDYRTLGITREPASVRIERLAESLAILRQACAGESPSFHGRHYSVDGPAAWPRPAQQRIPILAGGGGKGILELAAAAADIVSISRDMQGGMASSWRRNVAGRDGGPERMDQRLSWIRAAAGPRFSQLQLQAVVGTVVVTSDKSAAAAAVGSALDLTAEEVLSSPHFLVGRVEEIVEDLQARRERWGISYWSVSGGLVREEDTLRKFARVIELTGR